MATHERLPLTYRVRQANVSDKVPAPKLLIEAVRLLHLTGLSIKTLISDAQYYPGRTLQTLKVAWNKTCNIGPAPNKEACHQP